MNNLLTNGHAKSIAIILFSVVFSAFLAVASVTAVLVGYGAFSAKSDDVKYDVLNQAAMEDGLALVYNYENYDYTPFVDSNNTNRTFEIYKIDKNCNDIGKPLESTHNTKHSGEYSFTTTTEEYNAHIYLPKDLKVDDNYKFISDMTEKAIDNKYLIAGASLILAIMSILLLLFICIGAGRKEDAEQVVLRKSDRLYVEVWIIIISLACAGFGALIDYLASEYLVELLFYSMSIVVLVVLLLTEFVYSLAIRIKAKKLCSTILIFVLLRYIFLSIRKVFNKIVDNKKTSVICIIIAIINCIMGAIGGPVGLVFFIVEGIGLTWLILFLITCMKTLQNGAKEIAEGNTETIVSTEKMPADLKQHGIYLNSINEGITKAVETQMKSERFKTELITNVSHDLKTPLTSIVNYVDLLKNEDINNNNVKEYIDVLDKQSARLKKLTEDLIEASKATTGNVNVQLEDCNVNVLLNQTAGEYGEKLSDSNLELVMDDVEEGSIILVDGRLLWRVFDNLLNNICKYSMPGSRVYIESKTLDDKVIIAFKNTSKYKLNINEEELMERFVRGDESRNTEGSGLGLSIAKSLTELMNGSLNIDIDGDLFKAILVFNK